MDFKNTSQCSESIRNLGIFNFPRQSGQNNYPEEQNREDKGRTERINAVNIPSYQSPECSLECHLLCTP